MHASYRNARAAGAPVAGAAAALAIVAAVLAVAIAPGLEQPGDAARRALLVVLAPLGAAWVAWRGAVRPARVFAGLLAAALVLGLASALAAPVAERAACLRDLALAAAPWLLGLAAAMCVDDPLLPLARGAAWSLAPLGALGLAQAWLGWEGLPQAHAPAATFVNRNTAAEALVVLVPLALAAALAARSARAARFSAALAAAGGLALLGATRCRGGWVALACGLALGAAAWLSGAARREGLAVLRGAAMPLAIVALGALLGFGLPSGRREPLPSTVQRLATLGAADDTTRAIRGALRENALRLVGEAPWLGAGPGRFAAVYPLVQRAARPTPGFGLERQPEHAENDPLEFAVDYGVPAALALFAALGGAVLVALRAAWRAARAEDALRHAALVAALGGALVHALVSFPLHSPATAAWCWLLAGAAWRGAGPGAALPRPAARAVLVVLLALALGGAWFGAGEWRGQAALARAVAAQRAGDCPAALAAVRDAAAAAPWVRRDRGLGAMVAYACESDPHRSLEALEPALAMHPHQLNLLLGVASRRLAAGDAARAAPAFEHAASIEPRLGRAWLGLAACREQTGDRAGARAACAEAVKYPKDAPAARGFCDALR